MLGDREQSRALGGDGHAARGMRVQHALGVVARAVNGAVNDEAGGVDGKRRVLRFVSLLVDLDQARGRDLVEEQPVRIDEEVVLGARNPGADVREDEILPAVPRHEPIAGREIHTHRPFLWRDLVLERSYGQG